jgi:Thermostable hemolysin
MLPRYLIQLQLIWISFTATSSVRRMLLHAGARLVELAEARSACAAGGRDDWGHYYSCDPRVMAGYLPLARRIPALWSATHAD